jgi:hypothetical protein
MPQEVRFLRYDEDGYVFAYPDDAMFARFPGAAEGEYTLRLVYKDIHIDVEYPVPEVDPRLAAEQLASQTLLGSPLQGDPVSFYNEKPQPLTSERIDAWRCRLGWHDPATPPLVIDSTFIMTPRGLYRIKLSAPPEEYEEYRWVLDSLLQTFSVSG